MLSGKGGVGKSTVAAQLAWSLAAKDAEVGLLDIDICGPSVPKMLGLEGQEIHQSNMGWSPVYVEENLGVMSIGFMLPNPDDAVIWRGPRKNGLIKQFLKDVHWGDLDYLVIDAPPGTSDEHISVAQFLRPCAQLCGNLAGAVIVTTPQEVALIDVRKEINFCKKTDIPILGVVENMSSLVCPATELRFKDDQGTDITHQVMDGIRSVLGSAMGSAMGSITAEVPVFYAPTSSTDTVSNGAEEMAKKAGVPFLGRIPLDPALSRAAEEGRWVLGAEMGQNHQAACAGALVGVIGNILSSIPRLEQGATK